jgi:phage terminase large subunit
MAPEIFAEQLRLLGKFYSCGGPIGGSYRNKALIGVERSHSSGQTVLRLLREHYKYFPLYWHREINRLTRRIGRRVGWVTDVTSRMPMLDALGELVRKDAIEIPSRDLLREMVTFVLWDDGKPQAEEGTHDDRVIALAIANQMEREHRHTRASGLPEYEPEDTLTG